MINEELCTGRVLDSLGAPSTPPSSLEDTFEQILRDIQHLISAEPNRCMLLQILNLFSIAQCF